MLPLLNFLLFLGQISASEFFRYVLVKESVLEISKMYS